MMDKYDVSVNMIAEFVGFYPSILVDGVWMWPIPGMPAPTTLEEAQRAFDVLDVEPWASADRKVTKVTRTEEDVWTLDLSYAGQLAAYWNHKP